MLRLILLSLLLVIPCVGCGDPPLYPVTGKVTLDGKAYERLIVYFHPVNGKANEFSIGVGETDKEGTLVLRSTAGNGLRRGKYRVSFTCVVPVNRRSSAMASPDGKNDDDRTLRTKELVPEQYMGEDSPVEFEVSTGDNIFEFDIPAAEARST